MSTESGIPTPLSITDFIRASREASGLGRVVFSGIDFSALTEDNLSGKGKRQLRRARERGDLQGDSFSLLEMIEAGLDSKDLLDKQTRNVAVRNTLAERKSKDFKSFTALEERFGADVSADMKDSFDKKVSDSTQGLLGGLDALNEGLAFLTGDIDAATSSAIWSNFREQFGNAQAARGALPSGEVDFRETVGGIEALQNIGLNQILGGSQAVAGALTANPFLNPEVAAGLEQTNFMAQMNDFILRRQINEAHRARGRVSPTNQFLNRVRDFGTAQLFDIVDTGVAGLKGLAGDFSGFTDFFNNQTGTGLGRSGTLTGQPQHGPVDIFTPDFQDPRTFGIQGPFS